jgi:hypothetical protein
MLRSPPAVREAIADSPIMQPVATTAIQPAGANRGPDTEPPITRPLASPPPRIPGWIILVVCPLVFAYFGTLASTGGRFAVTNLTPETWIGGLIGLVIGLVLWLDDRSLQRRLAERARLTAGDEDDRFPMILRPPSEALAVVMLVIPAVTGVLIFQREALHLSAGVVSILSVGTVLSTALLGYADCRRLAFAFTADQPDRTPPVHPIGTFVGMLLLWVVCYPLYFVARRRLGGKKLIAPGLAATAVFFVPTIALLYSGPDLPAANSPEVLATVKKAIESGPLYQARKNDFGPLTLSDPEEVSFDREKQIRVARAKITSNLGVQDVFYTVEWQNRGKGLFQVRVSDRQP